MRRFAVILAAAALAACQTPCPSPRAAATQVHFACADASNLVVTFARAPETARIEQEGYTALVLPARISGSGYRYTDDENELRGRTGEVVWARAGALETICRETP